MFAACLPASYQGHPRGTAHGVSDHILHGHVRSQVGAVLDVRSLSPAVCVSCHVCMCVVS